MVSIGAVTQAAINNAANSTSFSFTSTSGPLYLAVPLWFATATLNTVTYGGASLTRVVQSALSNAQDRVEWWRILAPTAGTASLALNFSNTGQSGEVAVFNTSGQDDTVPEGLSYSNASAATATATGTLAITDAVAGDLVLCAICNGGGLAITPGATGSLGISEIMDVASNGEESEAFTVTNACTSVSGSWSTAQSWAIGAITLKGVPPPGIAVQPNSPHWAFSRPPLMVA